MIMTVAFCFKEWIIAKKMISIVPALIYAGLFFARESHANFGGRRATLKTLAE